LRLRQSLYLIVSMLYLLTFCHSVFSIFVMFFFFNAPATAEIYTLSLHDALPISLAKVSPDEAVALHAGSDYRVLMIGFAPGHAYMGGLSPKLSVPRRASPRAIVPAGSVAIANDQTVVYPYAISGGWSIIGRTPLDV